MGETATVTVSTILTDVGSLVTAAVGWIGQYTTAITNNPLLLIFVVTAFVGLGVGLISRIIKL